MCMDMKAFIALLAFATICDAHGALLRPVPRTPKGWFVEGATDPIGFNSDAVFEFPDEIGQEFVCRSEIAKDSGEIWNAGQTVEIEGMFGVPHPGYCELFFSDDVDAPLREMRWFKVGNWKDCGTNFDMKPGTDFPERMTSTFNVFLPSWLPQGNAVFRFMWSAMHNGLPEYYVDCSDVTIQSSSSSLPVNVITYPMINQSPYNENINMWLSGDEDLNGNYWPNPQIPAEWMCGTPCAEAGASYNQCPLTAPGTKGYIDISRYASSMPSTSGAPTSSASTDDDDDSSSDDDDDSVTEQPTEGPQSTTNSVTVQPESTSGAATERPQSTNDPVQNDCPSFCTRRINWDLVCGWTRCAMCDECLEEAVTEQPNSITEQPDNVPNNCPSRCTREDNWDIVCNSWSGCAACDECSTLITSDPLTEEPDSTINSATERSESANSGADRRENGSLRLEIAFAMFIILTLHW